MLALAGEEGCLSAGECGDWPCSSISFYIVSAWLYSFADLSSPYCLSLAFCFDNSFTCPSKRAVSLLSGLLPVFTKSSSFWSSMTRLL